VVLVARSLGDDARGVAVTDRVSILVELALGEEDGELDLAGAGASVFPLPSRPAVSFEITRTPAPSMAAQSLSGRRDGGRRTNFRAVISAARTWLAAARAAPLASAARSALWP
jgi:hypothetical protein